MAEMNEYADLMDRLKAMIPDATAPAMTLNEVLTAIERRLCAGKAMDGYMGQIVARLKAMTGVDITNVDDGLALAEAKIKAGAEAQAENAYMHRIMGGVKAKVGALLLNQREKITDVCQALDVVQAEHVQRENMISDVIGELRLILGTPKTEDLTLSKIMDLLKANHQRLCEAVHVLTSTPMDRVVNETVRALGARDYLVRNRLSRLCTDAAMDGKTTDEVLSMIEAEQKTLTERLGTAYAREMSLVKELAEAKFALKQCLKVHDHVSEKLATAGKESADLARALHLAEDKINAQAKSVETFKAERETMIRFFDDMRSVLGERNATPKYIVATVAEMRGTMAQIMSAIGLPGDANPTPSEIVIKIATQIKDLDRVRDAIGLRESAPMDYVVQRIADTRRDLHWAQGTLSMVSTALSSSHAAERAEIMARLSGTIKERDRAQERFSELVGVLCEDLAMPFCGTNPIRDEIKTRSKELAEVRNALTGAVHELNTIKNTLGVGPGTTASEIADKFKDLPTHLDALNHVLRGVWTPADAVTAATGKIKYMQAQTARLCKIVGNAETLHGAVDMVASLASRVGKDESVERRALIRFLDMAESTTWHEISNEVVRRISYKDGVLAGIGDSIKTLAQIVGLDPTVASLPVPAPLPYVANTLTAIRDCLLAVAGHPGGESLSLNAALSLVQSKVSAVALSLGLSEYASLLVVGTAVENLRTARDLQARTITTLTTNQDAQIQGRYKIRERLLTLLCEDPNRAGTMTTDEVVNLLKSKFACLALNLSLPEDATLNTIMDRIQGLAPSAPILRDLLMAMGTMKTMDVNEAMTVAADKIKTLREGLYNLLNA